MAQGLVSRGDLLRAIIHHNGVLPPAVAESLGFFATKPRQLKERSDRKSVTSSGSSGSGVSTGGNFSRKPLYPIPFWQLVSYIREEIIPPDTEQTKTEQPPFRLPQKPPEYIILTPFADLVPRLREALSVHRPSRSLDIPRIVNRMSRGEPLNQLPRTHRYGWGSSLYVIEDRSDYLAPYVRDQALIQAHLTQLYPKNSFFPAIYSECHTKPQVFWPDGTVSPIDPKPGDQVLALSDLGSLARDGGQAAVFWERLGRELRDSGATALALLPCLPAECPEMVADQYHLLSWEHPAPEALDPEELQERANELLNHLSVAPRIEPDLLRRIRLALGRERYPARLESLVWQQQAMAASGLVAASLTVEETINRQKLFREKVGKEKEAALTTLRAVQESTIHLPYELWLETVVNFYDQYEEVFSEKEGEDRIHLLKYLAGKIQSPNGLPIGLQGREWLIGFNKRLAETVKKAPETKNACWILENYLNRKTELPPIDQQPFRVDIYHHGDSFQLLLQSLTLTSGSPVATMTSRDGLFRFESVIRQDSNTNIKRLWMSSSKPDQRFELSGHVAELEIRTDCEQLILHCRPKPAWADAMGRDCFGLWAEFVVKGNNDTVRQRLRWIPPGRFLMGSPEDEPGRWGAEGPQHPVILSKGYWLFDTPVTQALWQAVMGENPSRFKSPDRPVEQVSWEDCQKFLQKINKQNQGLKLSLPTEAQWEYGCRAGSTTALYSGSIEIIGEHNAPALHEIAWYGGNSGLEFELSNGYDSSGWEETQFEQKQAGTHPVAQKQANDWGLYDMLGNVWEWTADSNHDNYQGAPDDGSIWDDGKPGAERVFRGGSWYYRARICRSACRLWYEPGSRDGDLGFRPCARVQGESGQE